MAVEPNRWGIIYNPKAGTRKVQKRWDEIRGYIESRGVDFDYVHSEGYGSVERLARTLANNGYRTIVVVGGDGALNDALNGILSSSVENKTDIALGIIPNGIGNDFANEDWEITPSAQAPIWDSAPITSSALCSADIRTEEQDLFALGVPREYVEERRERAHAYAELHGRRAEDVLLAWWQEDQKKRTHKKRAPPNPNKSYDLEDFFEAALARSYESLAEA